MAKAYKGLKVLDLTHVLAGPFCSYQFALLGAEVIKVESPDMPDCARGRGPDVALNAQGLGLNYQVQGSNKRALCLDLKTDAGRAVLLRLAREADVFLENYNTGAMADLGLDYQAVKQVNPQIIYCSMTGYGPEAPRSGQGAYDNVIQAASGIISQSKGHKPGVSFVDYGAGYSAAFAVSAALYRRQMTGEGVFITCSMYETALLMMAPEAAAERNPADRQKIVEPGIQAYETRQGRLMLGAFTPRQYRKLGGVLAELGHPLEELQQIGNWEDVRTHQPAVKAQLEAIFASRPATEWAELLHQADIPADVVRSLKEAVHDPQLDAREFFATVDIPETEGELELPVAAYRMSGGEAEITRAAPRLGQDSVAILEQAGYSQAEIKSLQQQGVVR